MKVLNVRFSETQQLKINDVSEAVGIDASKVSRAAMRLGLQQILSAISEDKEDAKEMVLINDAMAK